MLEAWADGSFELILSPEIFDEYLRTCERLAESHPELRFHGILLWLLGAATLVPDSDSEDAITRDLADDKFMLCARDNRAHVVSGDRHLLEVSGWSGVQVYTPRAFLDRLRSAT